MAISLKHAKNSAKADGGDATLVQPSDWNAEHALTLAADKVLGRATTPGAYQELTFSAFMQTLAAATDAASFFTLAICVPIFPILERSGNRPASPSSPCICDSAPLADSGTCPPSTSFKAF